MTYLVRWANEQRAQNMPTPAELEAEGWYRVGNHPLYPKSILMRKDEDDAVL